jgi:hypothetical protein
LLSSGAHYVIERPHLTGIELMRMLRKGQLDGEEMKGLTVAEQFYKLAA